jgi:glycosyltransferase involved in cell wall biosynthesis
LVVSLENSAFGGVSVVLPILNEERYLKHAVEAILEQKYPGKLEVILALGPSNDRTNEIAQSLHANDNRVILVDNPSGKTAAGLNAAIRASHFEIICRIDGHAEISSTYIRDAVAIMHETDAVNVGGVMAAVGKSAFERAVATAMRSPLGVGGARFHIGGTAGPSDTVYLGCFKKSALMQVGLYNEHFIRAQDWELNYRLRQTGGLIWFDPRLSVTYRPRPTIRALAKQYFEYGRWRHAVVRTHKGTANYRYLAPPTATLIITSSLLLSPINFWALLPAATYMAAILFGSFAIGKSWSERFILPAVLSTMHLAWGIGYLTSPRTLAQ